MLRTDSTASTAIVRAVAARKVIVEGDRVRARMGKPMLYQRSQRRQRREWRGITWPFPAQCLEFGLRMPIWSSMEGMVVGLQTRGSSGERSTPE